MSHHGIFGLTKDIVVAFGDQHGLGSIRLREDHSTLRFHERDEGGVKGRRIKGPRYVTIARIITFEMETFLDSSTTAQPA